MTRATSQLTIGSFLVLIDLGAFYLDGSFTVRKVECSRQACFAIEYVSME
jgi:hypothetical protein